MAPITTASNEENHAELLNTLDMYKIQKPFRNPAWKPPQRRNKNLKQILSEAQRAQQSLITTQQNSGASTPHLASGTEDSNDQTNSVPTAEDLGRAVLNKSLKANNTAPILASMPSVTYTSIAAAPSFKPKKKYCDITGLPAKYKDPKSGLYYHNAEVYGVIKTLGTAQVQEYLALRGANTILK